MFTTTRSRRRLAALGAVAALSPLPALAAGLYSVNPGFHVESALWGSGPASGDAFGKALATGDFNGDGIDDLATGIPGDDMLVAGNGLVLVRHGVSGVGLAGGQTRIGALTPSWGGGFGETLASGDFDDDGYDDLAVGSSPYASDSTGARVGLVQVYYGSAVGLGMSRAMVFDRDTPGMPDNGVGSQFEDHFGTALAAADFDGDGFADLAIGHPGYGADFDQDCGRMVALYGTASGLSTAGSRAFTQDHPGMDGGNESNDHFGAALAAGDFDNDGYGDVVVGVPGENGHGGGFQVIMGGSTGLSEARNELWTQNDDGVPELEEPGDNLGATLAVDDFDGDGFDDIAVAAPYEDLEPAGGGTIPDAGVVHVYPGSALGITTDGAFAITCSDTLLGVSEASDVWGQALAAGDFDRDGFADLAIAAPGEYLESLAAVGELTVLRGSSNGLTKDGGRNWQQNKPGVPDVNEQGDLFGRALAAGDFDANGYDDLAIGGPGESTGSFAGNGARWVLYGYLFADGFELGNLSAWQQSTSNVRGANGVLAYPVTDLGPPESQQALRVGLFDPAIVPTRPAWVMAGPARGFAGETRLRGSFSIDPQGLTMGTGPGVNAFQMIAFADSAGATAANARLAFDLVRSGSTWRIHANHRNDDAGGLQIAGIGALATVGDLTTRNIRIDYEWRAGNPGRLTLWRTRYIGGAPDTAGRVQLFAADLPGMTSATISYVYVGMIAYQGAGTSGALLLDELSFSDPATD